MGTQLHEDADRDGIETAAMCARGAGDHDEDTDGLVDACDNCGHVQHGARERRWRRPR